MITLEIGKKLFVALVVIAVMAGAYGITLNITHPANIHHTSGITSVSITMVITTNNNFNQTIGEQPHYYVLNNGSLGSTDSMVFPDSINITLTIINYDNGTAFPLGESSQSAGSGSGQSQLYSVNGTVGNVVKVINNTNVNSTQTGGVSGGNVVSSFPPESIAHTFTIPAINLNIPIPPSSTVVAQLHFSPSQDGTYNWQCEAPCGNGANGWSGAMATIGWMTGSVTIGSS